MIYHVAYPNPSLRPNDRVCGCDIDPKTYRAGLLSKLYQEYPRYTQDLKEATFWKVIRSSIIRCLPSTTASQFTGLKRSDTRGDPPQKVFDLIRKEEGTELPRGYPLVKSFPEGPYDEPEDLVDILVVTPDSTSLRANHNHYF